MSKLTNPHSPKNGKRNLLQKNKSYTIIDTYVDKLQNIIKFAIIMINLIKIKIYIINV
jgi:hypothetical protein